MELINVNRALLSEYTRVLAGQIPWFSSSYFGKNNSGGRNKLAETLFRYAVEIFLHWSPWDVRDRMTLDIIKEMKLDGVLKYMNLPPEIERDSEYGYIAHVLYPKIISYDVRALTIKTYLAVLNGKKDNARRDGDADLYKFPKKYFDHKEGRQRACYCMTYFVDHYVTGLEGINSIEDMYAFFASPAGTKALDDHMLHTVLRDVFRSPVTYFHESLPEEDRDDFLYHYYEFQYWFRNDERVLKKIGYLKTDKSSKKSVLSENNATDGTVQPKKRPGRKRKKKEFDETTDHPVKSA